MYNQTAINTNIGITELTVTGSSAATTTTTALSIKLGTARIYPVATHTTDIEGKDALLITGGYTDLAKTKKSSAVDLLTFNIVDSKPQYSIRSWSNSNAVNTSYK